MEKTIHQLYRRLKKQFVAKKNNKSWFFPVFSRFCITLLPEKYCNTKISKNARKLGVAKPHKSRGNTLAELSCAILVVTLALTVCYVICVNYLTGH